MVVAMTTMLQVEKGDRLQAYEKGNQRHICLQHIYQRSTEVGCLTNTNTEGGGYMKLDVIEPAGFCGPENKDTPCDSFMVGCCIIHFWCWEPGSGACC